MSQSPNLSEPGFLHLEGLASHARLSHAYWLTCARQGGNGRYPPAYCIEGAAAWRRRLGEILTQLRRK